MTKAEGERNLFQRTIGSEGFEKYSRERVSVIAAILLLGFGIGSVGYFIDAIDKEMVRRATSYGIQATLELGAAASIGIANVRSRRKRANN